MMCISLSTYARSLLKIIIAQIHTGSHTLLNVGILKPSLYSGVHINPFCLNIHILLILPIYFHIGCWQFFFLCFWVVRCQHILQLEFLCVYIWFTKYLLLKNKWVNVFPFISQLNLLLCTEDNFTLTYTIFTIVKLDSIRL